MSRRLVLPLLFFLGCKKAEDKPIAAPPAPPATTPDAAPAPTPSPEGAFRTGATDLAKAHAMVVQAWGTAELDDKPGPDRWAQLGPDEATGNMDHGAYVIEASGTVYVLDMYWDGRTQPWKEVKTDWDASKDAYIVHQQGHRGGFERRSFAVRGGEVIVATEITQNDVRDGDTPVETSYVDDKGACAKPCPKASDKEVPVATGATLAAASAAMKSN